MSHQVIVSPIAEKLLGQISDRRIRNTILDGIQKLNSHPELQGKPLTKELTGYRSIRLAGQRYRVLYEIKQTAVYVLMVGIRKEGSKNDVYTMARKLLRQGLLG